MVDSGDSRAATVVAATAVERRRIWWRSRRGLRELDLLLLPFVEDVFEYLEPEYQQIYLRLLDNEDPELLAWFTGRAVPLDPELVAMVDRIRAHQRPVS